MHELSVMAYMLERVETHAARLGATKVVTITLIVGDRSSFVDDSLLFYFDLLTPGTLAEGAHLNLKRTQMRCHCPRCGRDFHPSGVNFRCPDCNMAAEVTDDGCEMLIESLEVET